MGAGERHPSPWEVSSTAQLTSAVLCSQPGLLYHPAMLKPAWIVDRHLEFPATALELKRLHTRGCCWVMQWIAPPAPATLATWTVTTSWSGNRP